MHETAVQSADALQFLTFTIADEEYGVDILKVQEIKGYVPTTRLPNTPPEVTGVMNLRGTIVPIIDLRTQFGFEPIEYDRFAAIVVVVVDGRVVGMIADSVSEVMSIPFDEIQPITGHGADRFLKGIGKVGEKLVLLLRVESVLGHGQEAVAA